MTLVSNSYGNGNNTFNPIHQSGGKITQDINLLCDDSKNIWHLYVRLVKTDKSCGWVDGLCDYRVSSLALALSLTTNKSFWWFIQFLISTYFSN